MGRGCSWRSDSPLPMLATPTNDTRTHELGGSYGTAVDTPTAGPPR